MVVIDIDGPGDGSSIQELLTSAQQHINDRGGGVISFTRPGVYGYEGSVEPTAPTTWKGVSTDVVLMRMKRANAVINTSLAERVVIQDLGFDMNGFRGAFGKVLTVRNSKYVRIEGNRFFDSNPATFRELIAEGDGLTKTFTHAWEPGDYQAFANHVVIRILDPRVDDPIEAEVLRVRDDGRGRWSGDESVDGSIFYGNNDGLGALTIQFRHPPSAGFHIVVDTARSDQRIPVAILNCEQAWVVGNSLHEGGRIKVGSPGKKCIVANNVLENVNDNGISVVDAGMTAGHSCELKIVDNVIYFPATTGIHVGADGEKENNSAMMLSNITVGGNTIVGNTMDGISLTLPAGAARRIHLHNNHIEALGPSSDQEELLRKVIEQERLQGRKVELKGRCGIQVTHVELFRDENTSDIDIHDNMVSGAFHTGLIFIKRGRHVIVHHNHLSGVDSDYGIQLNTLESSLIDHNNIRGVRFAVGQPATKQKTGKARSGPLRGVVITSNIIDSVNDRPNRGIVFFERASALERVRILGNSITGGTAEASVVTVTRTKNADVDIQLNDWSGSLCQGPRLLETESREGEPGASWSSSAVHADNKQNE